MPKRKAEGAAEGGEAQGQKKAATAATTGAPLRVLLGATGSVASVKVPEIAARLHGKAVDGRLIEVRVASTESALHFFKQADLPKGVELFRDADEWQWKKIGDPVLHIELRKWADVLVVAPLDANTLGKLAGGLSDNLLSSVARAWDYSNAMIVCPAMNTYMWEHPITASQLATLKGFGAIEVPPVAKLLACGDHGMGALAPVDTIVNQVLGKLAALAH